jgi:hypothetical protein
LMKLISLLSDWKKCRRQQLAVHWHRSQKIHLWKHLQLHW